MDNSPSTNNSFPFHQLPYWSSSHDVTISTLVSFRSTFVLLFVFTPLVLVKLTGYTRNGNPNQAPFPPGPTPWPVIGNFPEICKNKPAFWWILGLMKQLDADIAYIRLGNIRVIVVTSPDIAVEFLKKHDSVFASRPTTIAAEYATRGFLSTTLVPWGDQWKKMRKVVAANILSPATLGWLLHKRTQEADNLVRFIYNQCINSTESDDISNAGSVINLRLVVRQYTGNVFRRMMFNKRYFGKGKHDGGPRHEEVEYVESLFTVLMHINSFILSDYVPWLRSFDLEGLEKIVRDAMRIVNGFHDPIIDESVYQWREGKRNDRLLEVAKLPRVEREDRIEDLVQSEDVHGMQGSSQGLQLRRSLRQKREPGWHQDFVVYKA